MHSKNILLVLLLVSLLTVACGQTPGSSPSDSDDETGSTAPAAPTTTAISVDLAAIPPVDISQHIVPLEEIFFDTFRGSIVPLSDAEPQLIRRLLDAIPPIYNPKFETAANATWLNDDDLVLGYADGDEAYAYPIRILNWHEMASHEVNGRPILASY